MLWLTLFPLFVDLDHHRSPPFRLLKESLPKSLQAMQSAIGLTSLTYTVNDGTDYKDTYVRPGQVNVSDHSCYYMQYLQEACPNNNVTIHTVAHTYGDMNLAFENREYNNITDVLGSRHNYRFYRRSARQRQQFAYRFNEYNPNDREKVYPFMTNRTVTAEAVNCLTYNEVSADDKEPKTITYTNEDRTVNETISIPNRYLGREGTTYIYRGKYDPASAEQQSCGLRCVWMWAYKNPSGYPKGSPEPSALYKCPVNISLVGNAYRPEHAISDTMAKRAAASIALQGRFTGPVNDPNYMQYQFYASG